jgi:hypothetical protein
MNYFNLSEKIIDDETWKIILEREKIAKYKNYVTHNGTVTDLCASLAYPSEESRNDPSDPINILLQKFNSNLTMPDGKLVTFIKFKKGGGIFPHTDDAIKRYTTFAWAVNLNPVEFTPILFHDPMEKTKIIDRGYYKQEGIVFNTQKMHSVEPGSKERISFQISFSNPTEEVYDLYMTGQLLNN